MEPQDLLKLQILLKTRFTKPEFLLSKLVSSKSLTSSKTSFLHWARKSSKTFGLLNRIMPLLVVNSNKIFNYKRFY